MTKEDNEDFATKCWIYDNVYVDNDVKIGDHCHITGKYRGSSHRDCTINVKLNDKISVVFHNLEHYESYLIIQKLGKFNLKKRHTKLIIKIYELTSVISQVLLIASSC